jgi:hypothetical protein
MSESEALVVLVTLDGKDPVRNISERHKTVHRYKSGKRIKIK